MGREETKGLLNRAMEGDELARGDLLERLRPRFVLWATARMSRKLREKVDPEDIAQEVLLAVHKSLDRFEDASGGGFLPWLFKIAENRIRDAAEYHGALKRQPGPPRSFSQTSPSSHARRTEAVGRLKIAIGLLSEPHQEVIRLRRLEERETAEVARLMDRSENAVRILYCRALKELAQRMPDAV